MGAHQSQSTPASDVDVRPPCSNDEAAIEILSGLAQATMTPAQVRKAGEQVYMDNIKDMWKDVIEGAKAGRTSRYRVYVADSGFDEHHLQDHGVLPAAAKTVASPGALVLLVRHQETDTPEVGGQTGCVAPWQPVASVASLELAHKWAQHGVDYLGPVGGKSLSLCCGTVTTRLKNCLVTRRRNWPKRWRSTSRCRQRPKPRQPPPSAPRGRRRSARRRPPLPPPPRKRCRRRKRSARLPTPCCSLMAGAGVGVGAGTRAEAGGMFTLSKDPRSCSAVARGFDF